jgi:uracil phosphoribosyltransferase
MAQTLMTAEPITGPLRVIRHSTVAEALGRMRRRDTSTVEFRAAAHQIARALAYEATRNLPLSELEVETPLERVRIASLSGRIVATPILRAGLGMLQGFLDVVPTAATGYIGLRRNEETLLPYEYYRNLPDLTGAHLFLLDPMLATGGSINAALAALPLESIETVSILSIIAAPEGVGAVAAAYPDVSIYTASLDRALDANGFIRPGLGDAGDRLCETL